MPWPARRSPGCFLSVSSRGSGCVAGVEQPAEVRAPNAEAGAHGQLQALSPVGELGHLPTFGIDHDLPDFPGQRLGDGNRDGNVSGSS